MMSESDMSKKLRDANQSFLCSLYQTILENKPDDNIFFCPFSISVALSMTLAGAQENTEAQMKKTLGFEGLDQSQLHIAFKKMLTDVSGSVDGKPSGMLSVANGLFIQNDFQILQPFVDTVQKMYSAISKGLDFAGKTEEAMSQINDWVKGMTREKIPKLLEDLDPMTVLVIVNAIYFKGLWTNKFDPARTKMSNFYVKEDDVVQVKMMQLSEDLRHSFHEAADCDILELPYEDGKTSMVVVLPRKVDGLSKVELQISPAFFEECLSGLNCPWPCDVQLPSFKLEESYSLGPMLKSLGMTDLFEPSCANLRGISDKSDLCVSQVIHKSIVEVNEEGTEAAAATAVGIMLCCYKEPKAFKADHPFLFCIVDNTTRNIIFIGSLKKP